MHVTSMIPMRCLVLLVMLGGCAGARVRNDEAAANAQQSATPTVDARAAAAVAIGAIPKIDVH